MPRQASFDHLFADSDARRTHLDKISSHVADNGPDILFNDPGLFGIGTDFFPHFDELMEIVSPERTGKYFHSQPDREWMEEKSDKSATIIRHPDIIEENGDNMLCIPSAPFTSWEESVQNLPLITFMPRTVTGLQNLIKWGAERNLRVRAAGNQHSSSDTFSEDGHILVSMGNLQAAKQLPAVYPAMDPENQLQGIELVGKPFEKDGQRKVLCRIGAATYNYHFLDWAHDEKGGNFQWTLPLNVIMTEISFGGSNAMMCHGAGILNKTLSDRVRSVTFINALGELQTVNDPAQLKAAAGCFGLLGLVVSLTLELDEMTYAKLNTVEKKPYALTVPPPAHKPVPTHVLKNMDAENLAALEDKEAQEQARQEFIHRCQNHYYSEYFWYPFQEACWANTWHNNGDPAKAERYPGDLSEKLQRITTYMAYLGSHFIGDDIPPFIRKLQAKLMGFAAMLAHPNKPEIVCSLMDAIHFRRGIQNFKTRMAEFEIPIPDRQDGTPDWEVCYEAWWAMRDIVYAEEFEKTVPVRTTTEMRIMGGSDILMAAQYGNARTCSIEILTPVSVDQASWNAALQKFLDQLAGLKDDTGHFLNIRPHWAKLFDGLFIRRDRSWITEWDEKQKAALAEYITGNEPVISLPIRDYLKQIACREQIAAFKETFAAICQAGGYTPDDARNRFSNPLWDDLIFNLPAIRPEDQPQPAARKQGCFGFFFRPCHREQHPPGLAPAKPSPGCTIA